MRNASWTLSNFCRGRPQPDFTKIHYAIPVLVKVLNNTDVEEILIDICWALSYISDAGTSRISTIIQTGVVPRLQVLLEHSQLAISVACLRTIGNLLTGTDEETQVVIDAGVLDALNRLLTHQKKTVRKEVCWSVSNITAGNVQQVQLCIDTGIIDKLIFILTQDDTEVRKEAIWGLSNSTSNAND